MSPSVALPHVRLGDTNAGPHLLITAGVHGDEYEPMTAVRRLIGAFKKLSLRGSVTLIPVVNEAAFRRAERTAEDGLDMARICPGKADGSPTERVAAALAQFIREADYYIDLHTGGRRYDVEPLVGYALHRDERILEQQRAMAEAFDLPTIWGTQGRLEGRSLSVARDAGVPALYAEFRGGGGSPAAVDAYVNGCLNVAARLGLIDRELHLTQATYIVEDDRDQAGHLQVQYPAPIDGFFEPLVRLGEIVERDQPLGQIIDPLGEILATVPCHESGVVLFLRAIPPVCAGDALGGLLPITAPGKVTYPRE